MPAARDVRAVEEDARVADPRHRVDAAYGLRFSADTALRIRRVEVRVVSHVAADVLEGALGNDWDSPIWVTSGPSPEATAVVRRSFTLSQGMA
jgi:hypothetical protein